DTNREANAEISGRASETEPSDSFRWRGHVKPHRFRERGEPTGPHTGRLQPPTRPAVAGVHEVVGTVCVVEGVALAVRYARDEREPTTLVALDAARDELDQALVLFARDRGLPGSFGDAIFV